MLPAKRPPRVPHSTAQTASSSFTHWGGQRRYKAAGTPAFYTKRTGPWRGSAGGPLSVPRTRQSRDPDTDLLPRAQLLTLSLIANCSPARPCADLGPERLTPRQKPACILPNPRRGLGCEMPGLPRAPCSLTCMLPELLEHSGRWAQHREAGLHSQSHPARLSPSTFRKSSICLLKGTGVYTPLKG